MCVCGSFLAAVFYIWLNSWPQVSSPGEGPQSFSVLGFHLLKSESLSLRMIIEATAGKEGRQQRWGEWKCNDSLIVAFQCILVAAVVGCIGLLHEQASHYPSVNGVEHLWTLSHVELLMTVIVLAEGESIFIEMWPLAHFTQKSG